MLDHRDIEVGNPREGAECLHRLERLLLLRVK